MARLGKSWGVRGWQHLHSFTEPPDNILKLSHLALETAYQSGVYDARVEVAVKRHGDGYVIKLPQAEAREAASALSGRLLSVAPEQLPAITASDTWYWKDLVGCRVNNLQGATLGIVRELIDTGAHDVLVIKTQESETEHLVPFQDPYLQSVDTESREIVVDWDPAWSRD